jgi:cyclophilin family peptidyl-prolyl cis-trans isomerase
MQTAAAGRRGAASCLMPLLLAAGCGPQPPADLRSIFIPDAVVTAAGRPVNLELRLQNTGKGSAVLTDAPVLATGLRVEALKDGVPATALPPAPPPPAPGRTLPYVWPPGHREDMALDLASAFPGTSRAGRYRVSWNHPPFSVSSADVDVVEPYASIRTSVGEVVIEFHPEDAPQTVKNFVTLAAKGFYDGLVFHRIIPGFMMQGGCPKGDGSGGPGYTIKAEFNARKHVAGTVSMARTDKPDSAGSQFFICFDPPPGEKSHKHLDGQYTAFAEVVRGMDVVKKVETVGTPSGTPTQKVVMEKVTLLGSLPDSK